MESIKSGVSGLSLGNQTNILYEKRLRKAAEDDAVRLYNRVR